MSPIDLQTISDIELDYRRSPSISMSLIVDMGDIVATSFNAQGDQARPRPIEPALLVGIVLLPPVFVWFLLRKGHIARQQIPGFAWNAVFILWLILMVSAPGVAQRAKAAKPAEIAATDASSATPTATPSPKVDTRAENEAAYLSSMEATMAEARQTGLIHREENPEHTANLSTNLMGTVATLYKQGNFLFLSEEAEKKRVGYRRELGQIQAKAFPQLRAGHAKTLRDRLWEHNIEVSVGGPGNTTLRLKGFLFASNGNIKSVFETAEDQLMALRFKRVEFRSHGNGAYYDLKPLPDSALAILLRGRWMLVP